MKKNVLYFISTLINYISSTFRSYKYISSFIHQIIINDLRISFVGGNVCKAKTHLLKSIPV